MLGEVHGVVPFLGRHRVSAVIPREDTDHGWPRGHALDISCVYSTLRMILGSLKLTSERNTQNGSVFLAGRSPGAGCDLRQGHRTVSLVSAACVRRCRTAVWARAPAGRGRSLGPPSFGRRARGWAGASTRASCEEQAGSPASSLEIQSVCDNDGGSARSARHGRGSGSALSASGPSALLARPWPEGEVSGPEGASCTHAGVEQPPGVRNVGTRPRCGGSRQGVTVT